MSLFFCFYLRQSIWFPLDRKRSMEPWHKPLDRNALLETPTIWFAQSQENGNLLILATPLP